MIELCSNPNTEFSPSWKYSKSFADISNIPALKVELINGIYGFWRKGGF